MTSSPPLSITLTDLLQNVKIQQEPGKPDRILYQSAPPPVNPTKVDITAEELLAGPLKHLDPKMPVKLTSIQSQDINRDETREKAKNLTQDPANPHNQSFNKVTNKHKKWEITIPFKGMKKAISHFQGPQFLSSVLAAPELLEKAIWVGREEYTGDNPKIECYQRFIAPIRIDDQFYRVRLTVRQFEDGKRYYDQNLTEIDGPLPLSGLSPSFQVLGEPSTSKNNIEDQSGDVKTETEGADGSLQESGPEPVYQAPSEPPASEITLTDLLQNVKVQKEQGKPDRILYQSAPASFAPPFFSQLSTVAEDKLPGKGSAHQMAQTLRSWAKKGMFKQEELEWSGVLEWLYDLDGKVSKEEVLEFIEANRIRVEEVEATEHRYEPYTLEGGENYRELLLTWQPEGRDYRSIHWREPNVIAHVRFNERTDGQGNKVLFIEEIQSDWHQEGRRKGYKETPESFDGVADAPLPGPDPRPEAGRAGPGPGSTAGI